MIENPKLSTRRGWMKAATQAAGAVALASHVPQVMAAPSQSPSLPLRSAFPIAGTDVYLNSAGSHPFSQGALDAIQSYLQQKAEGKSSGRGERVDDDVKAHYAALIDAPVSTVSLVPRTIAGENLVVSILDVANGGGNIVTDELHFQGSLNLYRALQSKGVDVRIIKDRNWRIELADLDKVIDRKTKLVAISAVSQVNGFQHDLKAVSDLAHARGAYVYADVVQAVGAIPLNLPASGIDFGSCGSQKWLMGDYGVAFFYAREGLLEDLLKRAQLGVQQATGPGNRLFANSLGDEAATPQFSLGKSLYLETGSVSQIVLAALNYSLPLIRRIGLETIHAHNSNLLAKARKELPRLGYELATPEDSLGPIASFSYAAEKRQAINAKLKDAKVEVKVDQRVIRVSPSIFNNEADITKLVAALA